MPKVRLLGDSEGYIHKCPACKTTHYIAVGKPLNNGACWTFNGDLECPTFSPSIRIKYPNVDYCCHYFVREGNIEFCGDCTHELAGQTISLEAVFENTD